MNAPAGDGVGVGLAVGVGVPADGFTDAVTDGGVVPVPASSESSPDVHDVKMVHAASTEMAEAIALRLTIRAGWRGRWAAASG